MAGYRQFDKASRWQNAVPLCILQQTTHVRTANWIGAVQHHQPEMLERCRPPYCVIDKLPHLMLPTRKLGTALITAQVMTERNNRWLVVPEQCAELRGVTRHQPVAWRCLAFVIKDDVMADGESVRHMRC